MDCAENGLAGGGKFAKKTDDVEGGLRVETGSRLIKEEEKFRFRGELDTN